LGLGDEGRPAHREQLARGVVVDHIDTNVVHGAILAPTRAPCVRVHHAFPDPAHAHPPPTGPQPQHPAPSTQHPTSPPPVHADSRIPPGRDPALADTGRRSHPHAHAHTHPGNPPRRLPLTPRAGFLPGGIPLSARGRGPCSGGS